MQKASAHRSDYLSVWVRPFLFVTVPLYLYVNLFAFSGTPFLLGGDQIYFQVYTRRMLQGEQVYRDFFQFTPPGTDLVYLAFFRVFGAHIRTVNLVVFLLGSALCWLCFSMARRLMERWAAMLTTLLFLVCIYGRVLNATHHWFSLLAALCAVRVVMPERSPLRVMTAGAFAGAASCFTQTAGVAVLLALAFCLAAEEFSGKKSWRMTAEHLFLLLAAFFVVVGLVWASLAANVGWKRLWYFQVTYPARYLPYWFGAWFPGLPEPLTLHALPRLAPYLAVYILLPVIYLWTLGQLWRRRRELASKVDMQVLLLALTGLFLLLEILPGVNFLRVFCISMPGVILLVWSLTRSGRLRGGVMTAAWVVLACLAAGQTWSRHRQQDRLAQFPAGRVLLSAQKEEKFSWLMQHTRPGDFLFQAAWMDVYLPLELRNPVFPDALLANEQTRPEFVGQSMQQLESRRVKYILWSPLLNHPIDPRRPWEDHLDPMRAYVQKHYARVHVFSDKDEVWERNQEAF